MRRYPCAVGRCPTLHNHLLSQWKVTSSVQLPITTITTVSRYLIVGYCSSIVQQAPNWMCYPSPLWEDAHQFGNIIDYLYWLLNWDSQKDGLWTKVHYTGFLKSPSLPLYFVPRFNLLRNKQLDFGLITRLKNPIRSKPWCHPSYSQLCLPSSPSCPINYLLTTTGLSIHPWVTRTSNGLASTVELGPTHSWHQHSWAWT